MAIASAAPTTSSSRATSLSGGQTSAKRPPCVRTSDAAPSSARRPVESQNSTSVRSTSRRGRRPARVASSSAHSDGAVAMSSSPATAISRTPASSRSCDGEVDGSAHRDTFSRSVRGVNIVLRRPASSRRCRRACARPSALLLRLGLREHDARPLRLATPTGPLGPCASIAHPEAPARGRRPGDRVRAVGQLELAAEGEPAAAAHAHLDRRDLRDREAHGGRVAGAAAAAAARCRSGSARARSGRSAGAAAQYVRRSVRAHMSPRNSSISWW